MRQIWIRSGCWSAVISLLFVLFSGSTFCQNFETKNKNPLEKEWISSVQVEPSFYRASDEREMTLSFNLSRSASISIWICCLTECLCFPVVQEIQCKSGAQEFKWQVKDIIDASIPDGDYYLQIESRAEDGTEATYPVESEMGYVQSLSRIEVDQKRKEISFDLPTTAKICVRIGISNGPLLKTLVDWDFMQKGNHHLNWDGFDEQRLVDFFDHPLRQIRILSYKIPDTAFTIWGQDDAEKDEWCSKLKSKGIPIKQTSPLGNDSVLISPFFKSGIEGSKALNLNVKCINKDLNGEVTFYYDKNNEILVDFYSDEPLSVWKRTYEVYVFLDLTFLSESPYVELPYVIKIPSGVVPPGKHLMTINVISEIGQAGVKSLRIDSRKSGEGDDTKEDEDA